MYDGSVLCFRVSPGKRTPGYWVYPGWEDTLTKERVDDGRGERGGVNKDQEQYNNKVRIGKKQLFR